MEKERLEIDICPDYGGCFNFGDGGGGSLPEELKAHPRAAEIFAIEKALEVWADWFDTTDSYTENTTFKWDLFYSVGERLARELHEILGDDHTVLFRHGPLPATAEGAVANQ
jgi:hypothetical protein